MAARMCLPSQTPKVQSEEGDHSGTIGIELNKVICISMGIIFYADTYKQQIKRFVYANESDMHTHIRFMSE